MGFGKKSAPPPAAPPAPAAPTATFTQQETDKPSAGEETRARQAARARENPQSASLLQQGEGSGDVDPLSQRKRLQPGAGASMLG